MKQSLFIEYAIPHVYKDCKGKMKGGIGWNLGSSGSCGI